MLLYGRTYFVSLSSPHYIFEGFTKFVCNENQDQQLQITYTNFTVSSPETLFSSNWVSSTGGIWVYYFDPNDKILSTNLKIYDYNNNTLGNWVYGSSSVANTFNFTYAGANRSRTYWINFTVNGTDGSKHTFSGFMYKNETTMRRFSGAHINKFMNMTFGYSPLRQIDNPDVYVPWIDILVAAIGVLLVCSFPGQSANLAALATGGFFVFAGSVINGIYPVTITLGIVFIIFGALYSWRNKT